MTTKEILINAKKAKNILFTLTKEQKTEAILEMADCLENSFEEILSENEKDIESAKGVISDVMTDRLRLTKERIFDMAKGMREVALLPDPVGSVLSERERADGLIIKKVCVPIGVVATIYESRPNVTSDVAAICLKSGNVSILRGGKEAYRSAKAIVDALHKGLMNKGLPTELINLISDTTRQSAVELMTANSFVDILIPRGGKGLIEACVKNATVPCIHTGTGICHVYVDNDADFNMALDIIDNAKTSRPSVCNAAEVLLVNEDIAKEFLPKVKHVLTEQKIKNGKIPVELRLCEKAQKIISGTPAGTDDFDTEFLDYILAVKIVKDVNEAVEHIAAHSTGHSEAIISENKENIAVFTQMVDSSSVYVNASTRFTDGGEFGLGCEIGISTQKLHARGPMGIEELTTYKYIIEGKGHIR